MSRAAVARGLVIVLAHAAASGSAPAGQPSLEERRRAVLRIEEARAPTAGDVAILLEAAQAPDAGLQTTALRALGRLERTELIAMLLPFLQAERQSARDEAANAIAQSFRGEVPPGVPPADRVQTALQALLAVPPSDAVHRSVGRLPYATVAQVRAAETALRAGAEAGSAGAARALESMARLHRRIATLEPATLEVLRAIAARTARTHPVDARKNAMAALLATQGADGATVAAVLRDEHPEVRRLAALALAGAASPLTPADRPDLIRVALRDRAAMVRLEAVRASGALAAETGCAPLLNALDDTSLHVVLAALDALGEGCQDDEAVTGRLTYEARTPPAQGSWHREAHAFVALAKRSPQRASAAMLSFARHPVWQVRMYAARAAAALNDAATLARLASDADDNVAAAALPPLRRHLGSDSDAAFIAALNRRTRSVARQVPIRPYDLIRTAAVELKGAAPRAALLDSLLEALLRITAERCETSRDVRLALLDRIAEFGSAAQEHALNALVRDFDPRVAAAAASAIRGWTGRQPSVQPERLGRPMPEISRADDRVFVRVTMEGGRNFWIAFAAEQAPLSTARFLRLVRDGYYDGLTFHRVVPNFVIQGGSPGANEYCGDCPYWRDEVGLLSHTRGTIGISTRGRDTGDAQIFINLVDSPRLDHQYTVFARVCHGMDVVDGIHEGDRMRSVAEAAPPPQCG